MKKTDFEVEEETDSGIETKSLQTYSESDRIRNKMARENSQLIWNMEFIKFDPDLLDFGLTYFETALYGFMKYYLGKKGRVRFYFTNEQISALFRVSIDTVSLGIKKLAKMGVIKPKYNIIQGEGKKRFINACDCNFNTTTEIPDFIKRKNPISSNGNSVNIKTISQRQYTTIGFSDIDSESNDTPDSKKDLEVKDTPPTPQVAPPPRPNAVEQDFESIWKQYPRPLGRKAALKHYCASVKTDEDRGNINKALKNYCNYVKGKDEQYIQHGSTWFNNWQDWTNLTTNNKAEQDDLARIAKADEMMRGQ